MTITITRIRRFNLRNLLLPTFFLLAASAAHAADVIHVSPGTEVRLQLSEPLSSEFARKGQVFKLAVEKDVRLQGQVVIPKGTPASGIVTRTSASSVGGKPGEVYVRIEYLMLHGQRIALFSGSGERGKGSEGSAAVLTALFGPIGVLTRGKEVIFPVGMSFLAYIDQSFDAPVASVSPVIDNVTSEATSAVKTENTALQPQAPITSENAARIENVQQKDKL